MGTLKRKSGLPHKPELDETKGGEMVLKQETGWRRPKNEKGEVVGKKRG